MRKALWLFFLVGWLSGAGLAADTEIVAGKRVGPFRLGMTPNQIRQELGPPTSRRPNDVNTIWVYSKFGLEFDMGLDGVDEIRVKTSRYATSEGVRVGMSQAEAEQALGPPSFREADLLAYAEGDTVVLMLGVSRGKLQWISVIKVGKWW